MRVTAQPLSLFHTRHGGTSAAFVRRLHHLAAAFLLDRRYRRSVGRFRRILRPRGSRVWTTSESSALLRESPRDAPRGGSAAPPAVDDLGLSLGDGGSDEGADDRERRHSLVGQDEKQPTLPVELARHQ